MSGDTGLPPAGYLANEDRGPSYLAFIIVMTVVPIAAVCLRFWSRSLIVTTSMHPRRFWWDDWFALAALPVITNNQIVVIAMIRLGWGKHIWNVQPRNLETGLQLEWALLILYGVGASLSKASALLFYSRIFRRQVMPPWFKGILYMTHGLNILWFIGNTLAALLMCHPISASWNPAAGKCSSQGIYFLGMSVPHVVIDFIILMLPLPIIWNLNTTGSRKVALTVIFICGYSTIVMSIGRVVWAFRDKDAMAKDLTYASIPLFYWFGAEIPITLLSVCLPAMSHLASRTHHKLVSLKDSFTQSLLSDRSHSHKGSQAPSTTESLGTLHEKQTSNSDTLDGHLGYKSSGYKAYASFAGTDCDSMTDEPLRQARGELDEGRIYVDRAVTVAKTEV